jgi:hypothetical protein
MRYVGLGLDSSLSLRTTSASSNISRPVKPPPPKEKSRPRLSQTARSLYGSREESAKVPMRTAVTLFAAMLYLFIPAALIRL